MAGPFFSGPYNYDLCVRVHDLRVSTLGMRKDIHSFSKRILYVKPSDSPGFVGRTISHSKSSSYHLVVYVVNIINLNGDIRYGGSRTAFASNADLDLHGAAKAVCANPGQVHEYLQPENVVIKVVC